jgi:adenylylsulfate kinase-like enzyme
VSAPYEPPAQPELTVRTAEAAVEASVDAVVSMLVAGGVLRAGW